MKSQKLFPAIVIAAISLATAWAIRGQFGHEQGAAWAGSFGALSIVLLAKRQDWYAKIFQLTLASAAGWGIGGIASYGLVVGYGRSTEFGNAYYGLVMLFIIGGLFGLLGGGLFGIALGDSKEKPVKWYNLIVEMTIGGIIFYYLLIEEFGWLMTPPRGEYWATCLGMAIAMFWYMIRQKQYAAIRVAVFAGFGAGFGFAFGNFLQVMGHVSKIKFNFWNVMEYSIGFFGGLGMAYGTFTSEWPVSEMKTNRNKLIAPLLILTLIIPFFVWDQSFETKRLVETIQSFDPVADAAGITQFVQWIALLLILLTSGYWFYHFYFNNNENSIAIDHQDAIRFFLAHLGLYTIYSILITCAFMSLYRIEQYLYIINILVIGFFIRKFQPGFTNRGLNFTRWAINLIFILAFLAVIVVVAISSHGELIGAHNRFE
ncbi:hypothetical protein [Dyadobacter sp. CY356]|uniref:hypothetical protein n=1 Tax=Dyadobacter sp. CY356 TaxID=2906442 RepID=UPI001F3EE635|nr:hypothetical protein [Dyadobacter sp. CY356]MCF0058430.1 hypothetical protein [Dyadobacter sp. CY356]